MGFSKEIGETELIDDFHPIATAIIGDVGSSALHHEIRKHVNNIALKDFEEGFLSGETTTNPSTYLLDVGTAGRTTWEPDAEIRWEYLEFEDRDPKPLELTVPLMVQPRLSDVPELEKIEKVSEADIDIMKRFSHEDQVYPAIVTVCLDELPGSFEVTEVTFID